MRQDRSRNQILFNFLPGQTADLEGRIWKVKDWSEPEPFGVDEATIRDALIAELAGWGDRDNGFIAGLRAGLPIEVRTLNMERGVNVENYPRTFQCGRCRTISNRPTTCRNCGGNRFGQLPFVGYHECGAIYEPRIGRCPDHGLARINQPGSQRAAEIRFDCPKCGVVIQNGLGVRVCDCKRGPILYLPHRAGTIYQSHFLTLVNPSTRLSLDDLKAMGGPDAALNRVLNTERPTQDQRPTLTQLRTQVAHFPEDMREAMIRAAIESGGVRDDAADIDLSAVAPAMRQIATAEAVDLVIALNGGQLTVRQVAEVTQPDEQHVNEMVRRYENAMALGGVSTVVFCERFPVLRAAYGYTRGDREKAILQPFYRRTGYRLYGDLGLTEALLVMLDPVKVLSWLSQRHRTVVGHDDPAEARAALLRATSDLPGRFTPPDSGIGEDLVRLVHSYSHRLIRRIAAFAGIDRESITEHLLPSHASFFVYAQPRGAFVLGGLQALFETELDALFDDLVNAEHRCPLDPACSERSQAACPACLHIGEPSCRWFNRRLSRSVLFGPSGFIR